VDVELGGKCVLTNFRFRDIAGPVKLDPGTYDITVRLAAEPACSAAVAIAAPGVKLDPGADVSIGPTSPTQQRRRPLHPCLRTTPAGPEARPAWPVDLLPIGASRAARHVEDPPFSGSKLAPCRPKILATR
jgi:hypothetical protein